MSPTVEHLVVAPILLPLVTAALMVPLPERLRTVKAAIALLSTLGTVGIAVALLGIADAGAPDSASTISVYLLGNWQAPFGIVLVVDRLSALMLTLTGITVMAGLIFSITRWHSAGSYFHALVQFMLAGLNGVFLTGDLFNLFVFFEVLLAASYGLALHGSGVLRVKAGLHYIAINLAASALFLIGVSLIYGSTGTLNMADLAARIPAVPASERVLLEAGAAILGIAFLIKAGMWPLCFWLPATYSVAAPPVAAMFAILTKVGIYAILRLWLLLFGAGAGASAGFGHEWLLIGGIATVLFGLVGLLASQDLARLASYSVLVSSGTLLATIAVGNEGVTGGALFYLVVSTLSLAAFFLLIELFERGRIAGADMIAVTLEAFGDDDEKEIEPVGIAFPATMATLGIGFAVCALLLAGLPPLSGFIAKFLMLTALFQLPDPSQNAMPWLLMALLLVSGMVVLFALMRAGIRVFWVPVESNVPTVRFLELLPIVSLLALCVGLTVNAEPAARFMQATAHDLFLPETYVKRVLSAPSVERSLEERP